HNGATEFKMSVVDLATGQELGEDDGAPLAFSPDGKWLAGRESVGGDVVFWDARDGHPAARRRGDTAAGNALAFSRGGRRRRPGRRFVSASNDRTVRLWDTATGQCLFVFEGHTDEVFAAVFYPDGTRVASAGRDRAIWLWDPASGREVARLPGQTSYVWSMAL